MRQRSDAETWAQEQFGDADLGDARRSMRLVRLVTRAAEKPAGRLCDVLRSSRERDAGYDFIESSRVGVARLEQAVGLACARSCAGEGRVHIAVDGSSAKIVDRARRKGLGRIGADNKQAQGLKVMTALAVGADGATIGVLSQSFWARPVVASRTEKQKRRDRTRKTPRQKETRHWLETIERAADRLKGASVMGWFQRTRTAMGAVRDRPASAPLAA